jgi:predicted NACHT family NTPase
VQGLHATMRLPHAGTTRQVPYDQLFVALKVSPPREKDSQKVEPTSIENVLEHASHVVVLGNPGGGKSIQSDKLTFDIASGKINVFVNRAPFRVVLKDYASAVCGADRTSLAEYLTSLCRSPYHIEPPESAIEYMLLNDRAVVILDGLDELLDTSLRREVVQAVEGFAHRYPTCPMVVTSRRIGYDEAPLNEYMFIKLELGEFDVVQVEEYVERWFALDDSLSPSRREQLGNAFMKDSAFVSDLRTNPLLLSLMCGIYASENYIPRNRPDVYEKCALLLFDRWDRQRGIVSPLPFDAHVQSAMRSLALYMFTKHSTEEGISRSRLIEYMRDYLREKRFDSDEAAENAATEFIEFCKGRAWVLTDVGSDTYGFTHRTFLEYFAASQLVRLNPDPGALLKSLIPHLRIESWDVVAQLALQILGRTVEDGADNFLQLLLDAASVDKAPAKLNLISFACRALEFIVLGLKW